MLEQLEGVEVFTTFSAPNYLHLLSPLLFRPLLPFLPFCFCSQSVILLHVFVYTSGDHYKHRISIENMLEAITSVLLFCSIFAVWKLYIKLSLIIRCKKKTHHCQYGGSCQKVRLHGNVPWVMCIGCRQDARASVFAL